MLEGEGGGRGSEVRVRAANSAGDSEGSSISVSMRLVREEEPGRAEATIPSIGLRPWYGYGEGELDPLGEESAVCDMID